MKRKKLQLDESTLMTNDELSKINGGTYRVRNRVKNGDGSRTKTKFVYPGEPE